MTRTSGKEWPTWLRDADTVGADVEITEAGRVIWHDGIWRGGVWHGGDWHGGVWRGGIWRGGYDNPTRCMFPVSGDGENIHVGCKTYSLDEARALCESGDLPDEAPKRDSEAGRLLRAAVLAQIAWHEALE